MFITFTNETYLKTGSTALEGSTFFDSYKSENALKFFTIGSINNAIMTLAAQGLVEGTHFTITD